MDNRMIAAACLLSALGCAHAESAHSRQLATAQCEELTAGERELAQSEALPRVDRVEPYLQRDLRTRATQQLTYTAGARLYLPAQEGWSAPYLERVLTCHAAAQASGQAADPFQVAGVSDVDVSARGPRYVITIAGQTRQAGQQIWQRAEALRDQNARVEVRQLSRDTPKPTM